MWKTIWVMRRAKSMYVYDVKTQKLQVRGTPCKCCSRSQQRSSPSLRLWCWFYTIGTTTSAVSRPIKFILTFTRCVIRRARLFSDDLISWYDIFDKKLKNVSCEHARLNGWNSTLQAAWYILRVCIIPGTWYGFCQLTYDMIVNALFYTKYRSRVFYVLSLWRI